MPLVLADRVKETTTSTGTGTITLAGPATGFQSFSVIGNGNTTYYTIAGQGTSEWEVGISTYTVSGTTLSRDTVLASSAGAPTKTNFSAGTKDVFVTYTAARSVNVDGSSIDTFGLGSAQGDLLYASGTDNFVLLPKSTTATRYLANTGSSNNPQWDQIDLANGITGTLPVTNGGTGQTTYTNGQLLIGNTTGNTLTKAALTQGTGITVTNGAGSITLTNAGVTSIAAGTGISVSASTGAVTVSSTASGGGGYIMNAYASPTTWTKPAGLKSVRVTVVGAGGNGGTAPANPGGVNSVSSGGGGGGAAIRYIDAPAIPGPVGVTAGGGTNSFGAFCSATAGSTGAGVQFPSVVIGAVGGAGSGGTVNITGQAGAPGSAATNPASGGTGGSSILGGGGRGAVGPNATGGVGGNFGGGGGGSARAAFTPTAGPGGTGAPGVVIVEEFY